MQRHKKKGSSDLQSVSWLVMLLLGCVPELKLYHLASGEGATASSDDKEGCRRQGYSRPQGAHELWGVADVGSWREPRVSADMLMTVRSGDSESAIWNQSHPWVARVLESMRPRHLLNLQAAGVKNFRGRCPYLWRGAQYSLA